MSQINRSLDSLQELHNFIAVRCNRKVGFAVTIEVADGNIVGRCRRADGKRTVEPAATPGRIQDAAPAGTDEVDPPIAVDVTNRKRWGTESGCNN